MVSKKERIRKLLEENEFDNQRVYKYYKEFDSEFKNKESFKRSVRRLNNGHKFKPTIENYISDKTRKISAKNDVSAKNKEIKILYKERINFEKILDSVRQELNNIKPYTDFNFDYERNISLESRYGSLVLSDIHYGEVVVSEHINGINEYNTSIAKKRVKKLCQENLKHCFLYGVNNEFHLLMLGDLISGVIHEEIAINNERPITQLIVELVEFLNSIIYLYSSNFQNVHVHCVVGNHGRLGNMRFKAKTQENFEYLVYLMLESANRSKNVSINVYESPSQIINIGKTKVKIEHGDGYSGSGGLVGLPIAGVFRDAIKERAMFEVVNKNFDMSIMGHFHKAITAYDISNKPVIINPSIIGANEFSINKLKSAFPASSYSLVFGENGLKSSELIKLN